MNILAIETTGAKASVALIDGENRIFSEHSAETLNHLQNLTLMAEKVLEKSQLQLGDVTAIAVSEGPGSFTGIRIGVSTARAIAQALSIQCIGVPTLETFRYNLPEYKGITCPIFDARRSQVYGGAYGLTESGETKESVKGDAYALSDYLELLGDVLRAGDTATFFGDGVEKYKKGIEEWQNSSLKGDIQIEFADEAVRYQTANSVAVLGAKLFAQGKVCSYGELLPNYMRKAEAERKLEEAGKR